MEKVLTVVAIIGGLLSILVVLTRSFSEVMRWLVRQEIHAQETDRVIKEIRNAIKECEQHQDELSSRIARLESQFSK